MSFGYSIGDFLEVAELALRIYREYRDAPAQFAAISNEVASLHLVLKDVDSTISKRELSPLSPEKAADLNQISTGCRSVLTELDDLLQKYKSVGKRTRWSWDRLKWHQSDIVELRSRIISHTGMLNAFNISLNSSVTSRIEQQLIQLRSEIQSGKREGSVITVSSMNAARGGDEDMWREIRNELKDAGITEENIREHREFIAIWLINAISSGQLVENAVGCAPQGDSQTSGNNSDNPEVESGKDKAFQGDFNLASDTDGERALPDEVDSEDDSDEFLTAAAQKIAEFQRLGREAMEASDYGEAQQVLQKAKVLADLFFGDGSRKAKDCSTLLEEANAPGSSLQRPYALRPPSPPSFSSSSDLSKASQDPEIAEKQRVGEEMAAKILGTLINAPTVGFLMPQAHGMRPAEWKLIRDVLRADSRAQNDLTHLCDLLEEKIIETTAERDKPA